ncbi:MAG: proline dehydrogenase family protein [Bacteroidota bacterium]|nr:proline dehydrogenase family protein [Bacteroidota bacterium]
MNQISMDDTATAFKAKSDGELKKAHLLFRAIGINWFVNMGPSLLKIAQALRLPIKGIIKKTIFAQFCGGENIEECSKTIELLNKYHVGTILDYSVEGEGNDESYQHTTNETIDTILKAKDNPTIPFSVFKMTGVFPHDLLQAFTEKQSYNEQELEKAAARVDKICKTAHDNHVRIFIDAEESWIQNAIDHVAETMMQRYNKNTAIVYNTLQLYRHDRLDYLKKLHTMCAEYNIYMGVKLVRGAYMEKERLRAQQMSYPSPIQPDKKSCDHDYDESLKFCVEHISNTYVCVGTHNEQSSMLMVKLMVDNNIDPCDERIYFSQLLGMSDHISFNLSAAGYRVAKYVPYGPVKSVLPYLIRRAQENTSAKGQAGRELQLIEKELKRRKSVK